MIDTRHDELAELAAAYVLDGLDASDRDRFESHLRTCADCQTDVNAYRDVAAAIGSSVEPVSPPGRLKARVVANATAASNVRQFERAPIAGIDNAPDLARPARLPWLALAASLALAVSAGSYAWTLRARLNDERRLSAQADARVETLRKSMATLRGDSARANRLIDILEAPDVVRVTLTGTNAGPSSAEGHAYWSPSRGLWFTANGLPVLSPGRVYQLWLVLPKQAPLSAGLMSVGATGSGLLLAAPPQGANRPKPAEVTVAVTDEPAAGSPGPTSPILLAGSAKPE